MRQNKNLNYEGSNRLETKKEKTTEYAVRCSKRKILRPYMSVRMQGNSSNSEEGYNKGKKLRKKK